MVPASASLPLPQRLLRYLGRPFLARIFWSLAVLLLALLLGLVVLLEASLGTGSPVVNHAGLQRMRLQKMATEAQAVAMEQRHTDTDGSRHTAQLTQARQELEAVMAKFQETHKRLTRKGGNTGALADDRVQELLDRVGTEWQAYRSLLGPLPAPNEEVPGRVEAVVAKSREIWRVMNQVVARLEAVDRARSRREKRLVLGLSAVVLGLVPVVLGVGIVQLRLARFEPVTGLPNRTEFARHLGGAIERSRRRQVRLAVLLVDLDQFRDINDSLGFEAGDRILQALAARLRQTVPAGSRIASNGGGDRFGILLEGVEGPDAAQRTAQAVLRAFEHPLSEGVGGLRVRSSIGIAHFPEDGQNSLDLLRRAEAAMGRAKLEGGNRYHSFDLAMVSHANERLFLTTELRWALETDSLAIHYQPVVKPDTSRVIGLEALVRWPHPERGWISPAAFLPVAEETGLLTDVDRWVRRHALAQLRTWLDEGRGPLRLAINVDVKDLRDPQFGERVSGELAEAGVSPAEVELEVTEATFMEPGSLQETVLQDLRERGISVAIDDFGTGYSSLAYLRRLPADRLKVDRAFVRDLPSDAHNQTLVMTIMALAEGFGLGLLSEGVESREETDYLIKLGCSEAQGFYFARPMAAEDVAEHFL